MHSEPLIKPNYPPVPTELYNEKYTVSIKYMKSDKILSCGLAFVLNWKSKYYKYFYTGEC